MIITEIEPPHVHARAKNCGTSYEMGAEKGWKIKHSAHYRRARNIRFVIRVFASYVEIRFSCLRV
jgi:hypothetical protein